MNDIVEPDAEIVWLVGRQPEQRHHAPIGFAAILFDMPNEGAHTGSIERQLDAHIAVARRGTTVIE
jgi:hypothetical protein